MRITQEVGIAALASFIIGLPGETEETLRKTVDFAESLQREFGSLYGFHILSPFPGTELREKAAEYGLEILTNDWTRYDANQVVSRTKGADVATIQAVADAYDALMDRYLLYQEHLFAEEKLEGYELKMYLHRRRQALLWKLLLDDVVESFGPLRGDPVAALKTAVTEATGGDAAFVAEEMDRVLALGALETRPGPDGVRFAWTE